MRLQEAHLKEMGVAKVGHRLELAARVSELRRAAGVTGDGIDVHSLLAKYVVIHTHGSILALPTQRVGLCPDPSSCVYS